MKNLKKLGLFTTLIEVKIDEGFQHKRVVSSESFNYIKASGIKEPDEVTISIKAIYTGSNHGEEARDELRSKILEYLSKKLLT